MPKYYESPPPLSQVYLDNVLSRIPGSVYWKDKNGVYLGCNNFQAQIVGLNSPSEVIGKTDFDFPWRDHAAQLRETDQRIIKTGESEELLENLMLPDGTPITMLTRKSPLYDDAGNTIGIIGTSLDVTNLQKAEAQKNFALQKAVLAEEKVKLEEETSENLMILASSIAHDLRFPLEELEFFTKHVDDALPFLLDCYATLQDAGIEVKRKYSKEFLNLGLKFNSNGLPFLVSHFFSNLGHSVNDQSSTKFEAFEDSEFNGMKHIQSMKAYIDGSLQAMKDNIVKLSTKETFVECDSHKLLEKAIATYPFRQGERELVNLDDICHFKFEGEPDLFIRVIHNLISNSLDQIREKGKGEIYITSEDDDEDDYVIRFIDTAGGTTMEAKENMFRPYQTTKKAGTGIGLPFSKFSMKRMNGNLVCLLPQEDRVTFLVSFAKPEHFKKRNNRAVL